MTFEDPQGPQHRKLLWIEKFRLSAEVWAGEAANCREGGGRKGRASVALAGLWQSPVPAPAAPATALQGTGQKGTWKDASVTLLVQKPTGVMSSPPQARVSCSRCKRMCSGWSEGCGSSPVSSWTGTQSCPSRTLGTGFPPARGQVRGSLRTHHTTSLSFPGS